MRFVPFVGQIIAKSNMNPLLAKHASVVFAAILMIGCGRQHQGMTPEEIEAKIARIEAQMNAFEAFVKQNNVSLPYDGPPINESFGNSYDLQFLIGKNVSEYEKFFSVADGPTTDPPASIWSQDDSLVFYSWETNASLMTDDKAPSDRLMIAVRDGEITAYRFHGYYLH
jgi:hypothetical protein